MEVKDCIFCKIINKEIPTDLLFENDELVVFKDIHPLAPVHLLLVPKKHIRSINELGAEHRPFISEMINFFKIYTSFFRGSGNI